MNLFNPSDTAPRGRVGARLLPHALRTALVATALLLGGCASSWFELQGQGGARVGSGAIVVRASLPNQLIIRLRAVDYAGSWTFEDCRDPAFDALRPLAPGGRCAAGSALSAFGRRVSCAWVATDGTARGQCRAEDGSVFGFAWRPNGSDTPPPGT